MNRLVSIETIGRTCRRQLVVVASTVVVLVDVEVGRGMFRALKKPSAPGTLVHTWPPPRALLGDCAAHRLAATRLTYSSMRACAAPLRGVGAVGCDGGVACVTKIGDGVDPGVPPPPRVGFGDRIETSHVGPEGVASYHRHRPSLERDSLPVEIRWPRIVEDWPAVVHHRVVGAESSAAAAGGSLQSVRETRFG